MLLPIEVFLQINVRSPKDHLVWAVLSKVDAEGRSKRCGWKKSPCEVCKSVNYTSHFNIIKGPLAFISYQYCFAYMGSNKSKFRCRKNNNKSTYRKFRKNMLRKT